MKRICLAFVLSALVSAALAAGTQTATISSTTPTNLGAAPVVVQTLNQPVNVCIADSSPTVGTQCNILQPGPPVTFYPADVGSDVWASLLGSSSLIAYTPIYSSGSSIGSVTQGTVPWVDDVQQWADTVLGAPSNFGTSPGAVKVPGVNAYVTDFPSTYAVTGAFWQATQPVSLASLPALATGANVIGSVSQNGAWSVSVTSEVGVGATGAAVPATAQFAGMSVGGNLTGMTGTANGLKVDGSAVTQPVSGTFWQATQPVSGASAQFVDGWNVTAGAKADAASTATDTTPISQMSVEKQISKSAQAAVMALGSPFQSGGNISNTSFGATQSGTWAVTPTVPAASTMNLTSTTTAYTANQLVANSGTAGSITNPSFSVPTAGGAIPRLRLYSDDIGTGWQGATVQVDLWSSSPTWTNGDHAAWKPATGTAAHLASYSCTFPSAVWGDGLATECSINQGNYASVIATTIYWSVEVTAASGNAVTASQHLNLRPELN